MSDRTIWILFAVAAVVLWWRYAAGGPAAGGVAVLPDGTAAPIAPVGADPMGAATSNPYMPAALISPEEIAALAPGSYQAGYFGAPRMTKR